MKSVIVALLLMGAVAEANWWQKCWLAFGFGNTLESSISIVDGQVVYGKHTAVTSDFYNLEIQLQSLGLFALQRFDGQTITSMGEAFSALAPHLMDRGATVNAVDRVYAIRNMNYSQARDAAAITRFLNSKVNAITADAENTGLASNSQDLVLSHGMIATGPFQPLNKVAAILDESIRITRVGGEIRHFGFKSGDISPLRHYLEKAYPELQFEWIPINRVWMFQGRSIYNSGFLLLINKDADIQRRDVERPGGIRILGLS